MKTTPAGSARRLGPLCLLALGLGSLPALRAAAADAAGTAAPSPAQASAGALGQNLDYLRVRDVPDGLASARPSATGTLVLDLRFALAGADGGNALTSWLRTRARASAPVIVLFNAVTSQDLVSALRPGTLPPGVITLAPSGASLPADVLVSVDPTTDRAGYDAFANGTPLSSLVSAATDKPRFDESELIRRDAEENATGKSPAPKASPGNGGRGGPPGRRGGQTARPPLLDPMLQRAVQFHRTLLALGRVK